MVSLKLVAEVLIGTRFKAFIVGEIANLQHLAHLFLQRKVGKRIPCPFATAVLSQRLVRLLVGRGASCHVQEEREDEHCPKVIAAVGHKKAMVCFRAPIRLRFAGACRGYNSCLF